MYLLSTLENLDFKELTAAFILVLGAIFAFYEIWNKSNEIYTKSYKKRLDRETEKAMLYKHEKDLNSIINKLDTIIDKLNMQDKRADESNVVNFKYDLYKIYERCLDKGYATEEEMKCYLEKEKIYFSSGGNDFVHDKIHPFMIALPTQKEGE